MAKISPWRPTARKQNNITTLNNSVGDSANVLDLRLHDVAHFEHLRRLHRKSHPLGCAGQDDIPGTQREPRRKLLDNGAHVEGHVARAGVLALLAVDPHLDGEIGDVDLAGGYDAGA
eukprot:GDKK01060977.1.p1 GENE.GDKK01060977.1~~GDKK01060977.1.p1  ORF type:complete len:117 (+),score=12.03 GDKK01060977.1:57-407(+)